MQNDDSYKVNNNLASNSKILDEKLDKIYEKLSNINVDELIKANLQHKNNFLAVNMELENINNQIKKYNNYESEITKN